MTAGNNGASVVTAKLSGQTVKCCIMKTARKERILNVEKQVNGPHCEIDEAELVDVSMPRLVEIVLTNIDSGSGLNHE